ncbi:MAG: polysaccharide deacetylase family protein [Caldilineaceae bacterium]
MHATSIEKHVEGRRWGVDRAGWPMMGTKRLAQQGIKHGLLAWGQRQAVGAIAFLIYHSVSGRYPLELDLPPQLVERQLAYLAATGCVIDYATALQRLRAGEVGTAPSYVLTFDDGYRDFYTTVYPLLQRWQLPATLFVNTGFVDEGIGYPMLSHPQLAVEPVSWAMLGEMAESGLVTLGAHTHTHPVLTNCAPDQVVEELAQPLALFRRELGFVPDHFCYPQARWNPQVEALVQRYYATAVIGEGRWATATTFAPYRIPRLPIRRSDGWRFFQAKVQGRMANEEAFYARIKGLWSRQASAM